jgi:hypothetical protein
MELLTFAEFILFVFLTNFLHYCVGICIFEIKSLVGGLNYLQYFSKNCLDFLVGLVGIMIIMQFLLAVWCYWTAITKSAFKI